MPEPNWRADTRNPAKSHASASPVFVELYRKTSHRLHRFVVEGEKHERLLLFSLKRSLDLHALR